MGWPTSSLGLLPAPISQIAASHHIFVVALDRVADYVRHQLRFGSGRRSTAQAVSASLRGRRLARDLRLACEAQLRRRLRSVRQLKAASADLAGTDCRNPGTTQGAICTVSWNCWWLRPDSRGSLHAATAAPAAASISTTAGKSQSASAPLLLVNGDPTADIRQTRDIVASGRTVTRSIAQPGKRRSQNSRGRGPRRKSVPPPAGSIRLDRRFRTGRHAAVEIRRRLVPFHGQNGRRKIGGEKWRSRPVGRRPSKSYLLVDRRSHRWLCFPWSGVLFSPGPSMMAARQFSPPGGHPILAKGRRAHV